MAEEPSFSAKTSILKGELDLKTVLQFLPFGILIPWRCCVLCKMPHGAGQL